MAKSGNKRAPGGEMQRRMAELAGHLMNGRVREARQTRRHLNNMHVADRAVYQSLPDVAKEQFAKLYPAVVERLGVTVNPN